MSLSPPHSPTNAGAHFTSIEDFEAFLAQSDPTAQQEPNSTRSVCSEGSVSGAIIGGLDRLALGHTDGRGEYSQFGEIDDDCQNQTEGPIGHDDDWQHQSTAMGVLCASGLVLDAVSPGLQKVDQGCRECVVNRPRDFRVTTPLS